METAALTMRGGEHNDHEELVLLELVLPLHGEFRKSLEPIRVTPLWQGDSLSMSSCGCQTDGHRHPWWW